MSNPLRPKQEFRDTILSVNEMYEKSNNYALSKRGLEEDERNINSFDWSELFSFDLLYVALYITSLEIDALIRNNFEVESEFDALFHRYLQEFNDFKLSGDDDENQRELYNKMINKIERAIDNVLRHRQDDGVKYKQTESTPDGSFKDINRECSDKCNQEKWKTTLLCQICRQSETAGWLSRLKLQQHIDPEHIDDNVLYQLVINIVSFIGSQSSMFKDKTMVDRVMSDDVNESRLVTLQSWREWIIDPFISEWSKKDTCDKAENLSCKFRDLMLHRLELIEGRVFNPPEEIEKLTNMRLFLIGEQALRHPTFSKAGFKIFATRLLTKAMRLDTKVLLGLSHKVMGLEALTWGDLDALIIVLRQTKFSKMFLRHLETTLKGSGISLFDSELWHPS